MDDEGRAHARWVGGFVFTGLCFLAGCTKDISGLCFAFMVAGIYFLRYGR